MPLVTHIGGNPLIIEALTYCERQAGFTIESRASSFGPLSPARATAELSDTGELVHLHDLNAADEGLKGAIRAVRDSGRKVVLSLNQHDSRMIDATSVMSILNDVDHVLIGAAAVSALAQAHAGSWSWWTPGLLLPDPPEAYVQPSVIKLLHLVRPDGDLVSEVAELGSKNEKRGLVCVSQPVLEIKDSDHALRLLMEHDVLLEGTDSASFGIMAITAMAFGRTVLSGNTPVSHSLWPHLKMSPVLNTTRANLEQRLDAILREPRCLRDLHKRTRRYVETHHNAEVVVGDVLEIYSRLLEGNPDLQPY